MSRRLFAFPYLAYGGGFAGADGRGFLAIKKSGKKSFQKNQYFNYSNIAQNFPTAFYLQFQGPECYLMD